MFVAHPRRFRLGEGRWDVAQNLPGATGRRQRLPLVPRRVLLRRRGGSSHHISTSRAFRRGRMRDATSGSFREAKHKSSPINRGQLSGKSDGRFGSIAASNVHITRHEEFPREPISVFSHRPRQKNLGFLAEVSSFVASGRWHAGATATPLRQTTCPRNTPPDPRPGSPPTAVRAWGRGS